MATAASEPEDICANCGKLGGDNGVHLKKCSGCLLVKYCGPDCQRAHIPSHKTPCQKHAAKLHQEKLFADTPEPEECPVCLLRMPFEQEKICYRACCGKLICHGCSGTTMKIGVESGFEHATGFGDIDFKKMLDHPCPFCRASFSIKIEDTLKELQKRVDLGDRMAMYHLGIKLVKPKGSLQPNASKARELLLKSAQLGYPLANLSVGMFHYDGHYPSVFLQDKKKARHYFERGAIGGDPVARAYLAEIELDRYQFKTAYRHAMMSASCGYKLALDNVLNGCKAGVVTKDEYERTLRAYKKSCDELNSEHRLAAEQESSGFDSMDDSSQMSEVLNMMDRMRNMGRR